MYVRGQGDLKVPKEGKRGSFLLGESNALLMKGVRYMRVQKSDAFLHSHRYTSGQKGWERHAGISFESCFRCFHSLSLYWLSHEALAILYGNHSDDDPQDGSIHPIPQCLLSRGDLDRIEHDQRCCHTEVHQPSQ